MTANQTDPGNQTINAVVAADNLSREIVRLKREREHNDALARFYREAASIAVLDGLVSVAGNMNDNADKAERESKHLKAKIEGMFDAADFINIGPIVRYRVSSEGYETT